MRSDTLEVVQGELLADDDKLGVLDDLVEVSDDLAVVHDLSLDDRALLDVLDLLDDGHELLDNLSDVVDTLDGLSDHLTLAHNGVLGDLDDGTLLLGEDRDLLLQNLLDDGSVVSSARREPSSDTTQPSSRRF